MPFCPLPPTSTARLSLIVVTMLIFGGCTPPRTQMGKISDLQLQQEQLKQQELVIQSELAAEQRLNDVAYPMLKAAVPLCGKWITTRSGVMVTNVQAYKKDYQTAARSLGYSDSLTVVGVIHGSAAERAGLKAGDKVIGVEGAAAPVGKTAVSDFIQAITAKPAKRGEPALAALPTRLSVVRQEAPSAAAQEVALQVPPDTVCAYTPVAVKSDELNAYADGQRVFVTTAMLRFAGSDDELAIVASHEIAHDAMRHMDAKNKNATLGAILGAALDIAAATQGVNTHGDFTNQGAQIGGMTFSQDFEREADYVGMYIMARSGRPYADAANFWRRMAQEAPGSIKFASTHPTTAERFIRLERTADEIKAKLNSGAPLIPEAKAPGTEADSAAKH